MTRLTTPEGKYMELKRDGKAENYRRRMGL